MFSVALGSVALGSGGEAEPDRLADIERRLQALEAKPSSARDSDAKRIVLTGNADVYYWKGQRNSSAPDGALAIDNARIFFDATAGAGLPVGRLPVAREAGFLLEWDIFRDQERKLGLGSAYVRLEGLLDQDAIHLRLGRFPIPFGEEYLRWSEARPENPLFSFQAAGPYNWDEGVSLYGPLGRGFDYVLAVQNGDGAGVNENHGGMQTTIKLSCHAVEPWTFTLSGLDSGPLNGVGSRGTPRSAFEFWGSHAEPVHATGGLGVFQDGAAVPDDPAQGRWGELRLRAWELDATYRSASYGRIWAAAGQASIVTNGPGGFYDRDLRWYVLEGVLELEALRPDWQPFYLALRHSGLGTFSADRGYLLEGGFFGAGGGLGYNARSLLIHSIGAGLHINEQVTAKIEYLLLDYHAVRGLSPAQKRGADGRDAVLLGLSIRF